MSATTFFKNLILDTHFGSGSPATFYIGLTTVVPGALGSLSGEPVIGTNGYARVPITNNEANFPDAVGGEKSNANAVSFPQSTGAWALGADLLYYFWADAASGGNVWQYAALTPPLRSVNASGITLSFAPGELKTIA